MPTCIAMLIDWKCGILVQSMSHFLAIIAQSQTMLTKTLHLTIDMSSWWAICNYNTIAWFFWDDNNITQWSSIHLKVAKLLHVNCLKHVSWSVGQRHTWRGFLIQFVINYSPYRTIIQTMNPFLFLGSCFNTFNLINKLTYKKIPLLCSITGSVLISITLESRTVILLMKSLNYW